MENSPICLETKRYAVVTGGNKGIGLEICKQLASNGIIVVLTSRDEKKGIEAVEKLKENGLSENIIFHKLDVADITSITSLADFIKTQFGKLDILVNNAGVGGTNLDGNALKIATQEAGDLFIPGERIQARLNDLETLTEDKLDELLSEFLNDFKNNNLEPNGWPLHISAYKLSKASMNAYTRIIADKYPTIRCNAVAPGYVKTDITGNNGFFTADEGAAFVSSVALLPYETCPSGVFFNMKEMSGF